MRGLAVAGEGSDFPSGRIDLFARLPCRRSSSEALHEVLKVERGGRRPRQSRFSPAAAYRLDKDPRLPSQSQTPCGRRRAEPLAYVWNGEVVAMLEAETGLRPIAIYDVLLLRHAHLNWGLRRTLERRIRAWRAVNGAEREVMFRQEHPPGRMGLSDLSDMADLRARLIPENIRNCAVSRCGA
jgi:hypothetical protein